MSASELLSIEEIDALINGSGELDLSPSLVGLANELEEDGLKLIAIANMLRDPGISLHVVANTLASQGYKLEVTEI